MWNVIGIWDALSAFLIHRSTPWPEFFMIETFGASMFFAASAMHLANLYLITHREVRHHYLEQGVPPRQDIVTKGKTSRRGRDPRIAPDLEP